MNFIKHCHDGGNSNRFEFQELKRSAFRESIIQNQCSCFALFSRQKQKKRKKKFDGFCKNNWNFVSFFLETISIYFFDVKFGLFALFAFDRMSVRNGRLKLKYYWIFSIQNDKKIIFFRHIFHWVNRKLLDGI